ncbi:MAG: OmpA family protein [Rhodoferax sp.]|nr:OmpA family protein [Rhodoferax sp.]
MPKPAPVVIAPVAPAPAAAVLVAAPTPAPVPVPRLPQAIKIQAYVLFNHNRSELEQARALTMERLAAALTRARESGTTLREVQLIGHADCTGSVARNEALALARVQTVRDYLLAKGIAPALIKTSVLGDRQPVSACKEKFTSRAEELECLLPNRRVEVNFLALRQP